MAKATANPTLVTAIAKRLDELFEGQIVVLDAPEADQAGKRSRFLTRSLAALALVEKAGVTPSVAAQCVTDGGEDDGIDAVLVDQARHYVYFVQSKWVSNGTGSVKLADFARFRDGVKSILGLNWNDDNKNLHRFKSDIELVLSDINAKVCAIFIHTGDHPVAANTQRKIDAFLKDHNDTFDDFLEFVHIGLRDVARTARSHARPENIDTQGMIESFGTVREPYKAVYGAISGADVVRWYEENGNRLFAENLRFHIDKSAVNDGISHTAENEPEKFWYFNNGITAICESFRKSPVGGSTTDHGLFEFRRISVINGAQTIGSLAKAKSSGVNLDRLKVHIRVISLVDTPDDFPVSVTNANNTQNDLSAVDFVAADPNQERIKRESSALGISYFYRRGESDSVSDKSFGIREATIAAACGSGDLKIAVASKRYISGLWENTKKDPYTRLFNDQTKALDLWMKVKVMREVDARLAEIAASLQGREKLVAVHGNRFVLYRLFSEYAASNTKIKNIIDQGKVAQITDEIFNKIKPVVNEKFSDSYPGNVFKNTDKQFEILDAIK